jgi:ketosteroid isomerase-like protein
MKNLFVLFVLIVFLGLSACTQKVDLEAEKAQVKTMIDQLEQLFETEDMEIFSRIYAHDSDMVIFGTDAAEHFVGWEPVKESFQQSFASFENTRLTVKDQVIKVHKSGEVAWFS